MPGQLLQRGELPQRTAFSATGCALSVRVASRREAMPQALRDAACWRKPLAEMVVACGKPLRV
ncbi:hypothetical protein [Nostoc sp.]|uniref:hypothetical protein n=1 Tax=Nostoc sp. TaxID=1180 RepID=UPI002FF68BA7